MIGIAKGATNLLLRKEVEQRLKLGRSALYDRLNPDSPYFDPDFPRPIRLGSGKNPSVRWVQEEVEAYIASRISATRQADQSIDWKSRMRQAKAGRGAA